MIKLSDYEITKPRSKMKNVTSLDRAATAMTSRVCDYQALSLAANDTLELFDAQFEREVGPMLITMVEKLAQQEAYQVQAAQIAAKMVEIYNGYTSLNEMNQAVMNRCVPLVVTHGHVLADAERQQAYIQVFPNMADGSPRKNEIISHATIIADNHADILERVEYYKKIIDAYKNDNRVVTSISDSLIAVGENRKPANIGAVDALYNKMFDAVSTLPPPQRVIGNKRIGFCAGYGNFGQENSIQARATKNILTDLSDAGISDPHKASALIAAATFTDPASPVQETILSEWEKVYNGLTLYQKTKAIDSVSSARGWNTHKALEPLYQLTQKQSAEIKRVSSEIRTAIAYYGNGSILTAAPK